MSTDNIARLLSVVVMAVIACALVALGIAIGIRPVVVAVGIVVLNVWLAADYVKAGRR